MSTTIELQRRLPAPPPRERAALEQRAKLLAWGGNAWHLIEFAIALAAGVAAGSVALIGFGLDSLIELAAGVRAVLQTGANEQHTAWSVRLRRRSAGPNPMRRMGSRPVAAARWAAALGAPTAPDPRRVLPSANRLDETSWTSASPHASA